MAFMHVHGPYWLFARGEYRKLQDSDAYENSPKGPKHPIETVETSPSSSLLTSIVDACLVHVRNNAVGHELLVLLPVLAVPRSEVSG